MFRAAWIRGWFRASGGQTEPDREGAQETGGEPAGVLAGPLCGHDLAKAAEPSCTFCILPRFTPAVKRVHEAPAFTPGGIAKSIRQKPPIHCRRFAGHAVGMEALEDGSLSFSSEFLPQCRIFEQLPEAAGQVFRIIGVDQ